VPGHNLFHQRRFRHTGEGGIRLRFYCPHGQALVTPDGGLSDAIRHAIKPYEVVDPYETVTNERSVSSNVSWNYTLTPVRNSFQSDYIILRAIEDHLITFRLAVAVITPRCSTSLLHILKSLRKMNLQFRTIDCCICRYTRGGDDYWPEVDEVAAEDLYALNCLRLGIPWRQRG
jgi:hypothetical protein